VGILNYLVILFLILQNSLFQKKIKELENDKKSKEVNILKSINKNIPLSLLNEIEDYINKLRTSTSNLSKKEYIFQNSIGDLMSHEKDLINNIFTDLQSHLILCEKNTGTWSVENINDIVLGKENPMILLTLKKGSP
jgi:exodeoxyribonuclease V alpha subunit